MTQGEKLYAALLRRKSFPLTKGDIERSYVALDPNSQRAMRRRHQGKVPDGMVPYAMYEALRRRLGLKPIELCLAMGYWRGSYCNWKDKGWLHPRVMKRAEAYAGKRWKDGKVQKLAMIIKVPAASRANAKWAVLRALSHDRFWRNLGAKVEFRRAA